jgi:tRNA-dihydrouridine synthase B
MSNSFEINPENDRSDTGQKPVGNGGECPQPDLPTRTQVSLGPLSVSPPLFQAPMAGYTNFAFRVLLRSLGGVGLLCTEMVSARGFLELDRRYQRLPERLWGVREEARPLAVQIWDNDPEKLALVAERLVEDFRISLLDINFGCPAEQITKGTACGAYLLRQPEVIARIVEKVVRRVAPVPVTAKIRLGWSDQEINAPEVAEAIEQAGGAGVFVHGRTAQQKYRGTADWSQISEVKRRVKRIPVIGNGDIRSAQQALDVLRAFSVDGVMIGRAALSRPWIFREAAALLNNSVVPPEPTSEEQYELLATLYRQLEVQFGNAKAGILMRRFASRFVVARKGAKRLRDLIHSSDSPSDLLDLLREFLLRGEIQGDRAQG